MRKFIIFFVFLSVYSCNNLTMVDVYKENLPQEIEGRVREIELYKGGGILLSVGTIEKYKNIGLDNNFIKGIKVGDYFIKKAHSNKCIIERNDSIIYLDCYDIPKEIRDSLGVIEEWSNYKKGYWHLKR